MTPRLKELFYKEIQPALKSQFGFKNLYMGPKIEKVVLNMGLGLDGNDSKILKSCEEDMAKITGQKPVITKFKKSVANFKTRKGSNAGLKVTLRKDKMYEFLDRLVNIALPRIKDFRGLSPKGFDNFGQFILVSNGFNHIFRFVGVIFCDYICTIFLKSKGFNYICTFFVIIYAQFL